MKNWVEVVREFPGLPNNEVFSSLKRSVTPVFRETDCDLVKCINIHTNYPTDNAVVFALVVEAATDDEAKRIAEQQCDAVITKASASLELV